jgi:uncharacterized protein (UPF0248 family)
MSEELRRQFNAAWTPEKYQTMLANLAADLGEPVPFRLNETPCFFGQDLAARMCDSGTELIRQITDSDEYFRASDACIPAHYRVPNEAPVPMFIQVDYGLIRNAAGALEPRLVEIQGFPSLYGFQPLLAEHYRRAYGLSPDLRYLMSRLERPRYDTLLRKAIVGRHDPENVILMEVDPDHQKTRCDFIATERITGIKTIDLRAIKQVGNKLFYPDGGRDVPIHRIYNRAIVDELDRKQVSAPFDWRDDLDVEWAGHPNWYFRLSKFSIPFLTHSTVPETHFFDQVDRLPDDPENWVLKPLYSFAGLGVIVGPTRADLEAVKDRSGYILQRRVTFSPVIETPHGGTMVEIRLMFLWLDGAKAPLPVNTILRTGRGKMMGVDHNKGLEWVGASAAFYV